MKTGAFAGVWINLRNAIIVRLEASGQKIFTLDSGLEEYHPKGGSRSKQPYGPQENISESNYLERRNHQLNQYFERVKEKLAGFEKLLIFGPSGAGVALGKVIGEDRTFEGVSVEVKPADKMSINQIAAFVRDHFGISYDSAKDKESK